MRVPNNIVTLSYAPTSWSNDWGSDMRPQLLTTRMPQIRAILPSMVSGFRVLTLNPKPLNPKP